MGLFFADFDVGKLYFGQNSVYLSVELTQINYHEYEYL